MTTFDAREEKPLEIFIEKGENAGDQHFLIVP